MSSEKDHLSAVWASVEEKTRLMEAAGLLLLSQEADGRKYVRPIIALACTLALCLLPMVSAGEEAYTVLARLAW
jgi:hypothetical protein